jgi:RING-like zinc finger
MPVNTRSVNAFAVNIINNIIDNVVNRPEIQNNVASVASVGSLDTDSAASLGLGCCSICCDDIQSDKGRFVLECGHTFHAKCILVEFQHRNRCPMCRTEVAESSAHKRSFMMPSSLRMYSSILHDAADHFIHDLGNITFANVVHRMMLLSSEDQELRSIQYPYIKRLLVQFASILIRGVAFSVRDHDHEIQEPVPIDIVDNMMDAMDADIDNSDYDAAISNPALDAAVAYQAIVTTDMNFDSSSHNDNVSSALIRRSVALAAMGSERAELSLRRASRIALRRQQFQDVHSLLQQAVREREREVVINQQLENQDQQIQDNPHVNIVISEHEHEEQEEEQQEEEDSNPYGLEF